MFTKLLIANRGEIAVRIIEACHQMGIVAVAIYSDVDAAALHVQLADEALRVGPPPALESYLNIPAVIQAARESGAQAVHPGYGFLAENADFAEAVEQAGLIWVGPPPAVIRLMGDKVAAKRLAAEAGVPILPGYSGEEQSEARIAAEAAAIGFPLMLKAAAGGGGKGMRTVERPEDLEAALEGAKREALSAFGSDRIFIEMLLLKPRHIEMQILADTHGNAVYLGERDCSVQRRHQKVIEETPSPVMTDTIRNDMGQAALRLVRAGGYTSAGTVEFLFANDSFYFLEMNTRIQVEHPITELVTGIDLVRSQIEIAAGQALPFSQLDITSQGHAIEARLYAEDAQQNFLPATGTLSVFSPPGGSGVRNDVGVFPGAEIAQYYDPLLAKISVHAGSRPEAVSRLQDALARYAVLGVTNNLSFLQWIVKHDEFRRGRVDTSFIDVHWSPPEEAVPGEVILAAAAADLTSKPAAGPWQRTGGWRIAGAERSLRYASGDNVYTTRLQRSGDCWAVDLDGSRREVQVQRASADRVVVREGERVLAFMVSDIPGGLAIEWNGETYRLERPSRSGMARGAGKASRASLEAPMPGTVVKVAVEPGQHVAIHQPLVVLEAMKMEHVIAAPHAGTVEEVLFAPGDLVPAGAAVVRLGQE